MFISNQADNATPIQGACAALPEHLRMLSFSSQVQFISLIVCVLLVPFKLLLILGTGVDNLSD